MSFDLHVFAYVLGVVFVAELPDKTALAALVLATRHRPLPVFFAAALALVVQSVIAVAAGGVLALLPIRPVHIGAGVLFLASAVFMWRRAREKHDEGAKDAAGEAAKEGFVRVFASTFGVVFVAEWGDLTQLGTAALAARFANPLSVFAGATLALTSVAALAVFVGNRAGKLLDVAVTSKLAAAVFAAIGIALVAGWL